VPGRLALSERSESKGVLACIEFIEMPRSIRTQTAHMGEPFGFWGRKWDTVLVLWTLLIIQK